MLYSPSLDDTPVATLVNEIEQRLGIIWVEANAINGYHLNELKDIFNGDTDDEVLDRSHPTVFTELKTYQSKVAIRYMNDKAGHGVFATKIYL